MSLRRRGKHSQNEIDKLRSSKDWNGASYALRKLNKSGIENGMSGETLEGLITAESLEARKDYQEAKLILQKVLQKDPENDEANALLGIIELKSGNESGVMSYLSKLKHNCHSLSSNSSFIRPMQIFSEAYYIKGNLFEKGGNRANAITTYEEFLKSSNLSEEVSSDAEVKQNCEKIAFRLALLYDHSDDWEHCLQTFRLAFRYSSASSENLSRIYSNFAKFLLRRISSNQWKPPMTKEESPSYYIPKDQVEECILLLLLFGETKEHKLAVEKRDIFDETFFDDLVIAYGKRHAYRKQVEAYEKLLSVSFGNFDYWFSFGNALAAAGKYKKAFLVLQYCLDLNPSSILTCLLITKICVNHIQHLIKDAILLCEKTIEKISREPINSEHSFLLPRLHHALGLAYSKSALKALSNDSKAELQQKAIGAYQTAYSLDQNDHLIVFHLALEYAETRQILKSMQLTRQSLLLNHSDAKSWLLLCLLLTSQNQYQDALQACDAGLEETYDVDLLILKSRLENLRGKENEALRAARDALRLFDELHENYEEDDDENDARSYTSFAKGDTTETDSFAEARGFTYTMPSEVNVLNEEKELGIDHSSIWLNISDLFTDLQQFKDARECLQQAKNYNALNPEIYYREGRIEETQENTSSAILQYQKTLSMDPLHKEAYLRLGLLFAKDGKNLLAEKYFESAIRQDERTHEAWHQLGMILQSRNDPRATEYFLTSVELERTCPLIDFSLISRSL
eukprot:TRINITY_DN363_c1_g1_i1.p1 TRINITY_DN363_c1_g1~~TRINITY_DN363_c1_g1_i1.p1  ORF type:complete len:742 (-),score=142.77 TRINITY_DN363_c1_g1_i1:35-2260(-)